MQAKVPVLPLVPILYQWRYRTGTIGPMDVNVKGLEPEVAERLAQQAAAELRLVVHQDHAPPWSP